MPRRIHPLTVCIRDLLLRGPDLHQQVERRVHHVLCGGVHAPLEHRPRLVHELVLAAYEGDRRLMEVAQPQRRGLKRLENRQEDGPGDEAVDDAVAGAPRAALGVGQPAIRGGDTWRFPTGSDGSVGLSGMRQLRGKQSAVKIWTSAVNVSALTPPAVTTGGAFDKVTDTQTSRVQPRKPKAEVACVGKV
jgi:hypothetical protein